MEMEIEKEKFFMLEAGEERWIYDTEKNGTVAMKEKISKNENLNSSNVSLWEVKPTGEKWKIREVPWSKIAIRMSRSERVDCKRREYLGL